MEYLKYYIVPTIWFFMLYLFSRVSRQILEKKIAGKLIFMRMMLSCQVKIEMV